MTKGWIELDATPDRIAHWPATSHAGSAGKRPHIVLVLDEASFDITAAPGIKVPPGYAQPFQSFDGKARKFVVEGSGGPTWYTEYNVLTGLSARSYGGLKFYVTRIAAGRVERGLPQALRRCGYQTFSLYPAYGAFLSARRFQTTAGIERIHRSAKRCAREYRRARSLLLRSGAAQILAKTTRNDKPKFIFVYTVANHFPWHRTLPARRQRRSGAISATEAEVDEYIRRQTMSARDYQRVHRAPQDANFPTSRSWWCGSATISRRFRRQIVEPSLDDAEMRRAHWRRTIRATSRPIMRSSGQLSRRPICRPRSTRLEAPYLPAGDPGGGRACRSILRSRSKRRYSNAASGVFYLCAGGAEARRFNRLLIDAGLIKGMVSR